DDQIKLRGIRIEPTDIETTLTRHPTITTTRVIVRNQRLIAYYMSNGQPAQESLRDFAARLLPSHMVPTDFVAIDAFPLTPSGKLDRNALPDPAPVAVTGRAPITDTQRQLCDLFGAVLDREVADIDADFFALGGHSLSSIRLISRVRSTFGVNLLLGDVFDHPTVAGVAALVDGAPTATLARPELVASQRPELVPVSAAQERMLIVDQLPETGVAYNYPLAFTVLADFDVEAFAAAVRDVVARHESLRTVFTEHDTGFAQHILDPDTSAPIDILDDDGTPLDQQIERLTAHRFDLTHDTPLRITIIRHPDHTTTV
ncbi:condensation domain-containing protein, partial [Mycolicibacterium obuense]|uniref:condensation domain-containing protein n=1 Tax=Mycolicibacterium obuense TaxID=1807 RepID=UPI0006544747